MEPMNQFVTRDATLGTLAVLKAGGPDAAAIVEATLTELGIDDDDAKAAWPASLTNDTTAEDHE